MKRAIVCAATIAAALAVHALAGHLLAGRDPILALIAGPRASTLALAAALLTARLFLFLLAPGWALYLLALAVLERRLSERDRSPR